MAVMALFDRLRRLKRHDIVPLAGGSMFIFAARVGGAVTTYGTQILLARWMGASELGTYIFAFAGCVLLYQVSTLGLAAGAYRFVVQYEIAGDLGRAKGYAVRARELAVVGSMVTALIVVACLWFVWRPQSDHVLLTRLLAFSAIPFFALIITNSNIARALSLMSISVLPNLLLRQLLLLLAVVVFHSFVGPLSAAIVAALMLGVVASLAFGQGAIVQRFLKKRYAGAVAAFETAHWLKISLPLLAAGGFIQYLQEANIFIAGLFLESHDLAVYNAAYRTANLANYGLSAIAMMAAPRMSRLFFERRMAQLQRIVTQQALLRTFFATCIVALLAPLGARILGLFGEEFQAGYWALLTLALSHLITGGAGPTIHLLSISGRQKICAVVFVVAMAATAVGNAILIPLLGLQGAALTVLLVTISWVSTSRFLVTRHIGIEPSIWGGLRRRRPPVRTPGAPKPEAGE